MASDGGIDGYSRTIVFLNCSDNNRASTVLTAFTNAVGSHGLPERIRTDLGGENVDIWRYMVEQHASMSVTGSSTHNERIERLWRDVYRCVGVIYDCFRQLDCLERDRHVLFAFRIHSMNQPLSSNLGTTTLCRQQIT